MSIFKAVLDFLSRPFLVKRDSDRILGEITLSVISSDKVIAILEISISEQFMWCYEKNQHPFQLSF